MGITLLKGFWSVFVTILKSFDWLFIALAVFIGLLIFDFFIVKFKFFKGAKREVISHINYDGKENFIDKYFVQLPRQFWANYYNRKIGAFPEHGIIIFTGPQRQGKTIAETKLLLDMQYKYPDVKVCTNYGYKYEDEVIDDWHKLVDYNNGEYGVICAIDECQNWFSSSMSRNFPPRMLATVTQNGKNRRLIIMSSHYFYNVAKPIRLHCTEIRDCRTYLSCFTVVKRFLPIMDADGNLIKRHFIGFYTFVHSDKLYNAYDTYRIIKNLSEAGFKDDNYGIIQGGSDYSESVSPPKRRKGKSRSALAELSVNQNIDDVFRGML